MATTQLPEGLRAEFGYAPSDVAPSGRTMDSQRLVTVCYIYDAANRMIADGSAMLRPDEPFNLTIGNEVALGRALKKTRGKFYHSKVPSEDPAQDPRHPANPLSMGL
jgi:hypothetical protein